MTPAPASASRVAAFTHRVWEYWDGGRLQIDARFAPALRAGGLTSCQAFLDFPGGELVRAVGTRRTVRIELPTDAGPRSFFLKRFGPRPWREVWKSALRWAPSIWGAHPEWEALNRFHALGLPTVTPVAHGQTSRGSFLLTLGIEQPRDLREWIARISAGPHVSRNMATRVRPVVGEVARLARHMHDGGLHHQDFYFNHLLWSGPGEPDQLVVIDLGRVRSLPRWRSRWIVKDLAQATFSLRETTRAERLRFLRLYLQRPLRRADRWLIRSVWGKARAIERHTRRHDL